MLNKCIGIISWLPDGEPLRTNRKTKLNKLITVIDTYFHLPIIIIAQNWNWDDFNLNYNSNSIKIYNYKEALGITKARIILREKLLKEDYDYFIFLDDDSNIIVGNENSIWEYLNQLDSHPNMFGLFKNRSWHRLLAISKYMLIRMSYDFIENYEAIRGEIWEDVAYIHTYKEIYPDKWFSIQINGLDEKQLPSEKDPYSTWYIHDSVHSNIGKKTNKIVDIWVKSLR